MKRSIVVVVLLLAMPLMVTGEQCGQMKCPKCTNQPSPTNCTSGCLTKDRCGCCLVCAKAKDEPCRGLNDYHGYCADGLYCIRSSNIAVGICKECMPACSIDYCGGSDKKDKICSATGVMKSASASSKDVCQHTTCGSCFFAAERDPPCTKCDHRNQAKVNSYSKCLKRYHVCLRQHYRSSPIQSLTAVTNNTAAGFIFCKET